MARFTKQNAAEFYAEHYGKSFFENLINFMTSGYVLGIELIADNSIKKWRALIGPTNSLKAKEEAPDSIRGMFGTDGTKNSVHGSDSIKSAQRELTFFFGVNTKLARTAIFNNVSFCLIKPNIIKT